MKSMMPTGTVTAAVVVVLAASVLTVQAEPRLIGKVTQARGPNVEASVIHQFSCAGSDEREGVNMYIYQYTERTGFRVIQPPLWGNAAGGRDVATWDAAVQMLAQACNARCELRHVIADVDLAKAKRAHDEAVLRYQRSGAQDQGARTDMICYESVYNKLRQQGLKGGG